ncbi:Uu.00g033130.m01.CDS01 [Anthostomella pinea]|uniref:Uu.00g033130.m01.CDS01 n=1 Tax=Anthostomella pinea TaxID=933095 RepID=A0AAI8YD77_9PEZI|nr:Uu.00g033130.m01.CDS01 [Anthostomella pinea]
MCFGSKDKDNSNDNAAKPAQIPQQPSSASHPAPKASMPQSYGAPPPGPPPGHNNYGAPPPGPPPSHNNYVAPPARPPPSKNNPFNDYAPPPGPPPPDHKQKSQHDWETAVPDTSLLPPPPSFFSGFDRSPANNATEAQAEEGERWCRDYPLYAPQPLDPNALNALNCGNINMFTPPYFRGELKHQDVGLWRGHTAKGAPDTCIASYPPLYNVAAHNPLRTGQKKTIYYEIRALPGCRREVSLALGFVAPPYPAFRLPGWHRASLGVHGDDGHRYVNDRWGGKAFTEAFRRCEVVGLGMEFTPNGYGGLAVDIFLTRDGVERGRWNLHEETDREQDLPVMGLEGAHDLCAAVGVFDQAEFEICFAPGRWAWKGYRG